MENIETSVNDYKRIIFLDIDGVLNGINFFMKRTSKQGYIDPECIKKLNKLKDIGAEIVISSSWGYDEGRTEKTLKECGLEIPIIGYTDHFYNDWICRGNEIEKWIHENMKGMGTKYGIEKDTGIPYYRKHFNENNIDYEYVIFDDNTDFLLGQKDNFIQTNERTGITEEDVERARKILTRS